MQNFLLPSLSLVDFKSPFKSSPVCFFSNQLWSINQKGPSCPNDSSLALCIRFSFLWKRDFSFWKTLGPVVNSDGWPILSFIYRDNRQCQNARFNSTISLFIDSHIENTGFYWRWIFLTWLDVSFYLTFTSNCQSSLARWTWLKGVVTLDFYLKKKRPCKAVRNLLGSHFFDL